MENYQVNEIKEKYSLMMTYTCKSKCGDANYDTLDGRYSIEDMKNNPSGFCYLHKCPHDLDAMLSCWFIIPVSN